MSQSCLKQSKMVGIESNVACFIGVNKVTFNVLIYRYK